MLACGGKGDDVIHFIGAFTKNTPARTVTMDNDGNGIATASHIGDNGPDQGPEIYPTPGEEITISANPDIGYKFKEWDVVSENVILSSTTTTSSTFTMPDGKVRIKANFEALSGTPNLVPVPAPVVFDSVRDDYSIPPAAKRVIIRNTGDKAASVTKIELSAGDISAFELSRESAITDIGPNGENQTFYVQPNSKLSAKTYKATITVTYDSGKTAQTSVEFKVIKTYTVTMYNTGNGTASATRTGESGQTIEGQTIQAVENEIITIFARPGNGYEFQGWAVVPDNESLTSTSQNIVRFAMRNQNVEITATFKALPPNTPYLILTPSLVSFTSVTEGYTRSSATPTYVTITNLGVGNADTHDVKLTTVSDDSTNPPFELNTDSIPTVKAGESEIFTVQPKLGLPAGTYTGAIIATYEDGKTATNYVYFEVKATYSITMQNDGHGSAIASPSGPVVQGTEILISAIPASGYEFNKWEINSGGVILLPSATDYSAIFYMRNRNVVITATFKDLPAATPNLILSPTSVDFGSLESGYTQPAVQTVTIINTGTVPANISIANPSDFTLSGPSSTTVAVGVPETFTVQPKSGLAAGIHSATITVTYDGGKTAICNVYFEVIATYTIKMESDGHGTPIATSSGLGVSGQVAQGTDISISAIPDNTYEFDHWEVIPAGIITLSNPTTSSQTFTMPAGDVTIKAYFKDAPNNTPILILTPDPLYLDSCEYGDSPTAKPVTITNNGTGTATIEEITINNDAFTLSGGPLDNSTIAVNETAPLLIVQPKPGLAVAKYNATIIVKYSGGRAATLNVYFEVTVKTYTITMQDDGNGTASIITSGPFVQGKDIGISAIAKGGYKFEKWEVISGGVVFLTSETDNPAIFTMPASDVEIKAHFKALPTVAAVVDSFMQIFILGEGSATIDWGDGSTPVTIDFLPGDAADWSNLNNYFTLSSSPGEKNIIITGDNIVGLGVVGDGKSTANLNLSQLSNLETFITFDLELPSLDVSQNTKLEFLACVNNSLTLLDVSKNTALAHLECSNNPLTSLNVSKNTALTDFECNNNSLTSLDVSENTALAHLECSENSLTSLNVSNNFALEYLLCSVNQLTELDLSNNNVLTYLNCKDNDMYYAELNAMFASLHVGDFSTYTVNVQGTPGVLESGYDPSIATSKGWAVEDW